MSMVFAGVLASVAALTTYLLAQPSKALELSETTTGQGQGRYVIVIRHGTKIELPQRFDLPIYPLSQCERKTLLEEIVPFLQKRGSVVEIICSPFVRTKQTALRVAQSIGVLGSAIRCMAGLGESFSSVSRQLRHCGEPQLYRVPIHGGVDPCMGKMDVGEVEIYLKAVEEVNAAGVPQDVEDEHYCAMPPQSKSEHAEMVDTTLRQIASSVPMERDLVIVTHSGNVHRALRVFAENANVISAHAKTCGAIVLFQPSQDCVNNMHVVAIAT